MLSRLHSLPLALLRPYFREDRAIRVGSGRVYVASADRALLALGWKLGCLGRLERALIGRHVRPGMFTVDIGAGIGLHTFDLARRVGAEGRVYALEPEPQSFRLLSRSLDEAGLVQVEARQVAAADRSGWMTLYRSERDGGDHRIFPAGDERPLATVRALRVDDLVAEEGRVDFVVLDVRGAETSVLRGMSETLRRNPGITLLCTLRPALLRHSGTGAAAFFEPLAEDGLVPHRIGRDGVAVPISAGAAWTSAEAAGALPLCLQRR
jgi:FkbM family methyltransferase